MILATIIDRIMHLLEEETAGLRAGQVLDHRDIANRKSMLAMELGALGRLVSSTPDEATAKRLGLLKSRLEENRTVLAANIAAVREVIGILTELMLAHESDGTDTIPAAQRKAAR